MKNKIALGGIIFLAILFMLPVLAQEEATNQNPNQLKNDSDKPPRENIPKDENVDLSKLKPVAVVDAGNIKLEDKGNNSYEISFDLMNREGIQPHVEYAIELVQKKEKEEVVVDRKTYDEILNIGNKEIISRTVSYQVPNYLSGKYTLFLEAENNAGLRLAYISAGEINLSGESKIEVKNDSCQVFFGEKQFDPKNIAQFLQDGFQNPSLRCAVKNISSGSISVYLKTDIYEESYLGGAAAAKKSDETSLSPNEEKEFKIDLAQLSEMQGPLVAVAVFSGDSQISKNFYYPFKNSGKASLFYNVRLDKDYYEKNETAKITADLRPAYPKGSIISVSITEENEMNCLEAKNNEENLNETGRMELSEKIIRNCFNPTLLVSIKDKNGNILDQEKYSVESRSQEAKDAVKKAGESSRKIKITILVFLGLIVLIKLFLAIYNKVKYRNFNMPLLLFFLTVGFLIFSHGASAATYVLPDTGYAGAVMGTSFTVTLNDPIPPREGNTTFYVPDDNLTFSASVTGNNIYWGSAVDVRFTFPPYYGNYLYYIYAFYDWDNGVMPIVLHEDYYYGGTLSNSVTYHPDSRYQISGDEGGGGWDYGYPIWNFTASKGLDASLSIWALNHDTYFKVKGTCGDGTDSSSYPAKYWRASCPTGDLESISCTSGGLATWTCYSVWGGGLPDANCSYNTGAPKAICGSANGVLTSTYPTTNLCSSGSPTTVTLYGSYYWTCNNGSQFWCQDYCSAPHITFDATPETNSQGGTETINFASIPNPTTTDQIALCSSTATDAACLSGTWFYSNSCSQSAGAVAKAAGNCNPILSPSSSFPPGTYQFRLFRNAGSTRVAVSNNFAVTYPPSTLSASPASNYIGNTETATFTNVFSTYDWIGLYTTEGTFQDYLYASGCGKSPAGALISAGSCNFPTSSLTARDYRFRLYNSSGTLTALSGVFTLSTPITCGSANGVPICGAPTTGLCSSGFPAVTDAGSKYTWTCGSNSCEAAKNCPTNPVCGTASNEKYCGTGPSSNLCSVGASTGASLSGSKYVWTCSNVNGSVDCSATKYCSTDAVWREVE
jgi:hypothetical protein